MVPVHLYESYLHREGGGEREKRERERRKREREREKIKRSVGR